MDEKEIMNGLRGLTLAEPELGFNPDDVAERAAKRRHNRRATLATGAGTITVAAAAVAVMVLTGMSDAMLNIDPGASSTTTAKPYPTKAKNPAHDISPQMARNDIHLRDVLPVLKPDAKEIKYDHIVQNYADHETVWDSMTEVVMFKDSAGPAQFNLIVSGPQATKMIRKLEDRCVPGLDGPKDKGGNPLKCNKIPQADGSTVVVEERFSLADGQDGVATPIGRDATHYRKDGSSVGVITGTMISGILAATYGNVGPDGHGIAGDRGQFPFTDEQLIAMVTDPAFTMNK